MSTALQFEILKLVTARYKIDHKQLRLKTKKSRVLSGRKSTVTMLCPKILMVFYQSEFSTCLTEHRLRSLIRVLFDKLA